MHNQNKKKQKSLLDRVDANAARSKLKSAGELQNKIKVREI